MKKTAAEPLGHPLGLLLSSTFFILIVAEILLRASPPMAVYIQTRNVVQQTHSEISPHPWIGYIPKRGFSAPFTNREFRTLININSHHMRDQEYALEKPAGTKRIAAMGDSFVFGWGVENEEIFTEVLENDFEGRLEVLNFGVAGYATYQQMERLKKDALLFHPDVVLFFIYGPPEGYPDGPSTPYVISGGKLKHVSPKLSLRKKISFFLSQNLYLYALWLEAKSLVLDKVSRVSVPTDPAQQQKEAEKGFQLLQELKALGEKENFKTLVVYIPIIASAEKGLEPEAAPIRLFCLEHQIPFLDLTGPLHSFWTTERRSPYFRIDDHWNRDGHRLVAETLKSYLETAHALDPKS